jgi:hypothetical protein
LNELSGWLSERKEPVPAGFGRHAGKKRLQFGRILRFGQPDQGGRPIAEDDPPVVDSVLIRRRYI